MADPGPAVAVGVDGHRQRRGGGDHANGERSGTHSRKRFMFG